MRQSADFRSAENQRVTVEEEINRTEQQISNLVRAQKSTQEQISKVMADEMVECILFPLLHLLFSERRTWTTSA